MTRVVHNHPVKPWDGPDKDYTIISHLPTGVEILTAMMRQGTPTLYVERIKPEETDKPPLFRCAIDAFYVMTGEPFEEVLDPGDRFKYVATVVRRHGENNADYFFHVYARMRML